jgi:hypothetical protein
MTVKIEIQFATMGEAKAVQAWAAIQRSQASYLSESKRTSAETLKGAGNFQIFDKNGRQAFSSLTSQARTLAQSMSGISMPTFSGVAGAGATVALAALGSMLKDMKALIDRQENARVATLPLAELTRDVRINFVPDESLANKDIEKRIALMAKRTRSTQQVCAAVMAQALSAKGGLSNEEAFSTGEAALRLKPNDSVTASAMSSRTMDISQIQKAYGQNADPGAVLGFFLEVQAAARQSSIEKTGQTAVPAISNAMLRGDTAEQAAERFAAMTQLGKDAEGNLTKTADINLQDQMNEFRLAKDGYKQIFKEMPGLEQSEDFARLRAAQSPTEQIKVVQSSPQLQEGFLRHESFRAGQSGVAEQIILNTPEWQAQLGASQRTIKPITDDSKKLYEQKIQELDAGEHQPVLTASQEVSSAIEAKQTSGPNARAGGVRKNLKDVLEQLDSNSEIGKYVAEKKFDFTVNNDMPELSGLETVQNLIERHRDRRPEKPADKQRWKSDYDLLQILEKSLKNQARSYGVPVSDEPGLGDPRNIRKALQQRVEENAQSYNLSGNPTHQDKLRRAENDLEAFDARHPELRPKEPTESATAKQGGQFSIPDLSSPKKEGEAPAAAQPQPAVETSAVDTTQPMAMPWGQMRPAEFYLGASMLGATETTPDVADASRITRTQAESPAVEPAAEAPQRSNSRSPIVEKALATAEREGIPEITPESLSETATQFGGDQAGLAKHVAGIFRDHAEQRRLKAAQVDRFTAIPPGMLVGPDVSEPPAAPQQPDMMTRLSGWMLGRTPAAPMPPSDLKGQWKDPSADRLDLAANEIQYETPQQTGSPQYEQQRRTEHEAEIASLLPPPVLEPATPATITQQSEPDRVLPAKPTPVVADASRVARMRDASPTIEPATPATITQQSEPDRVLPAKPTPVVADASRVVRMRDASPTLEPAAPATITQQSEPDQIVATPPTSIAPPVAHAARVPIAQPTIELATPATITQQSEADRVLPASTTPVVADASRVVRMQDASPTIEPAAPATITQQSEPDRVLPAKPTPVVADASRVVRMQDASPTLEPAAPATITQQSEADRVLPAKPTPVVADASRVVRMQDASPTDAIIERELASADENNLKNVSREGLTQSAAEFGDNTQGFAEHVAGFFRQQAASRREESAITTYKDNRTEPEQPGLMTQLSGWALGRTPPEVVQPTLGTSEVDPSADRLEKTANDIQYEIPSATAVAAVPPNKIPDDFLHPTAPSLNPTLDPALAELIQNNSNNPLTPLMDTEEFPRPSTEPAWAAADPANVMGLTPLQDPVTEAARVPEMSLAAEFTRDETTLPQMANVGQPPIANGNDFLTTDDEQQTTDNEPLTTNVKTWPKRELSEKENATWARINAKRGKRQPMSDKAQASMDRVNAGENSEVSKTSEFSRDTMARVQSGEKPKPAMSDKANAIMAKIAAMRVPSITPVERPAAGPILEPAAAPRLPATPRDEIAKLLKQHKEKPTRVPGGMRSGKPRSEKQLATKSKDASYRKEQSATRRKTQRSKAAPSSMSRPQVTNTSAETASVNMSPTNTLLSQLVKGQEALAAAFRGIAEQARQPVPVTISMKEPTWRNPTQRPNYQFNAEALNVS